MSNYDKSVNVAAGDLPQLLLELNEQFKHQQLACLETMLECTAVYDVERRIVAAATVTPEGNILVGSRHFSPIMRAQASASGANIKGAHRQGFIDQYDVWVDRELAYRIVQCNGQPFNQERNQSTTHLYSEGVW